MRPGPPSAFAPAAADGAPAASADGSTAPSDESFRRSCTWSVLPGRRKAFKVARASLPGVGAAADAAPAGTARPGSAPSPPRGTKPPRPRLAAVLAASLTASPAPSPASSGFVLQPRPGSAPDPAGADDAAARLRQVFRQRAALAHAAWPDGGEGRGHTWPSPFRVPATGARVGRAGAGARASAAPPPPPPPRFDDSPSRLYAKAGWRHGAKADLATLPALACRWPSRRASCLAAAAACVVAAHWRTVAAALAVIAPSPAAAVWMAAAVVLVAASGVAESVAHAGRRVAAAAATGAAAVERLCAVIDCLGLLPILLARLEAELGAVGTDIRTIRRKADWLPSRSTRGVVAARESVVD